MNVRAVVVVILLVAVVAVVAWNRQPPTAAVPLVSEKPTDKAYKTAPSGAADLRDTTRDRPDRERTSRPSGK
jgi:beta-lactam-binding protein with PASTA domain